MTESPHAVPSNPAIYQTVDETRPGDRSHWGAPLAAFNLDGWAREDFGPVGDECSLYWRPNPDGERFGFDFRLLAWHAGMPDDPNREVGNVCHGYADSDGVRHSWWGLNGGGWMTFRPRVLAAVMVRLAEIEALHCDLEER